MSLPDYVVFSYNKVYECECGGTDFWVVPNVPGLDCWSGLVCQGCKELYLFPEPIPRKDILKFTKEEVYGRAKAKK